MSPPQWLDSILAAAAITSTILLLGATFLVVLRTHKVQFSLRFLLLAIGSIAVSLGLWTAAIRFISAAPLRIAPGPGDEHMPTESPETEAPPAPAGDRRERPAEDPAEYLKPGPPQEPPG